MAVPVTQSSTSYTGPYDAVVIGTNNVIELMPEPTGAPSPITVLTNADIESCGPGQVCVATTISDDAGYVSSTVTQYFNTAPASVQSAVQEIVEAIEQGISEGQAGQTAASTNTASGPSSEYAKLITAVEGFASIIAAGSNVTTAGAGSITNTGLSPSSTSKTIAAGPTTYATEVTNAQGSITDEVVVVGSQSGTAYTSVLSEYADSITTTVQALPSGATIQTITTSTCTTAGALVTTTTSGSTVSTVFPELCTNGVAFLIFGLPDLSPGSSSTSVCHRAFSFPAGILWRLLCPPIGPLQVSIISVDPSELPPVVDPPGNNPPANSPPANSPPASSPPASSPPDDPEPTKPPSQSQSQEKSTTTSTTSSSSSSSSAPTATRYAVMPLLNTSASEFETLYAPFANQQNVTKSLNADGSLDFFALELNDTYAATLDANNDFIIIPESSIEIEEEDSGVTDPDLDGVNATTEAGTGQNVGARDFNSNQETQNPRLLKRAPLAGWMQRFTFWSMAIISLVPGLALPQYRHSSDTDYVYPYYYNSAVPPGQGVRVYLLDTGLNMQHPEFNGRLRQGVRQGQTQTDWNIDWLFPAVDYNERFYGTSAQGLPQQQYYTYSYYDPNAPNPSGGIHPAYSDFRWRPVAQGGSTPHGTRLSAFIMGDQLGLAPACSFTVVKLPQYTNGPLGSNANFPLFSVRSALGLIKQDIISRRVQGETSFVISSSLGYPFGYDRDEHPVRAERSFKRMWQSYLDWFNTNGIVIVASAGNSRTLVEGGEDVTLIPARLMQQPEIVVGSILPTGQAHPDSQGNIGDGILTVYAPGPYVRVVSSNAYGYTYEWISDTASQQAGALTSYASGITVGWIAYTLALGYSQYTDSPPRQGELPNQYAYRRTTELRRPVIPNGPPVIYNNAPAQAYQQCAGPAGYAKRDGSCPLASAELPSGSMVPEASVTAALAGIINDIQSNVSAIETQSSTTSLSGSVTSALAGIISDIQGTATGSPTTSSTTTNSATTTTTTTTSSSPPPPPPPPPSPSPNSAIAIYLQQYTNPSGASVATWFAYTYTPNSTSTNYSSSDPCTANSVGTTTVPNGTPVSDELTIYPTSMAISAYGKKMEYTSLNDTGVGWLDQSGTSSLVTNCEGIGNAEGQACGSEYTLTPRISCEWAQ